MGESKRCGNGKDHKPGFELWSKHAHGAIDSKPCVLKDIQFGSSGCSVFGSAQSCVKSSLGELFVVLCDEFPTALGTYLEAFVRDQRKFCSAHPLQVYSCSCSIGYSCCTRCSLVGGGEFWILHTGETCFFIM